MRLLLVEDDAPLANFLRKGLEAERYEVDVAAAAEQADEKLGNEEYDFVILDINLPGRSALEMLADLRPRKPALPVLVLSARGGIEDRVRGLDLGADDYVVKPFSFSELSARVRAVLRRAARPTTDHMVLKVADLQLSRLDRSVSRGGRRIDLTPKEFALLELLMRHAGHPVSRAAILDQVWALSLNTSTNIVDVYVNYLRKKIDSGFQQHLIRTVRGIGYEIEEAISGI